MLQIDHLHSRRRMALTPCTRPLMPWWWWRAPSTSAAAENSISELHGGLIIVDEFWILIPACPSTSKTDPSSIAPLIPNYLACCSRSSWTCCRRRPAICSSRFRFNSSHKPITRSRRW
jgi:hypothetical protein